VGRGSGVAGVDDRAFDQMVAPDSGEEKWPGDGAADAAGLVFDCGLAGML
jgi:hypothetical protein